MKRKFNLVILLALAPTFVYALGLGNLDLNSALNEPFDARIQLLSPTADELDSLKVGLADSEVFARAKIDRSFVLRKLKFALRRSVDDSPDYIRVFSQEPIREPFLNFLVELSWSNDRLFREYTVLLDPPLYDPNARASEFSQTSDVSIEVETAEVEITEVVTIDESDHKVVYADSYEQYISPAYTPSVNYTGGDYGTTTGSDTLWSLATAMRPDTSISVNKMMLALLRANPDAFINQNINGLKRGQILRMPNESEIIALNNAEALAEVQSQNIVWDAIRGNLSSAVTERPEISSVPDTTAPVSKDEMVSENAVEETDPELRLVAAEDTGEATEQVSSVDSGAGEDLTLAQESIQALTQENLELDGRLQESEALIEDLKRLLSLKDDELAALQEQMVAAQAETAIEAAMAEETMVEEVMEEEAEAEESIEEEPAEEVEVIETEPAPSSEGMMGKIDLYLGPAKSFVLGNPMIGMAIAGVLLILIIVVVLMKFRKESAETVHIDAKTEEAFPDFNSGDLGDTGAEVPDSEAVTVLPDSEVETDIPEESADFDIEEEETEEEKTQFMAADETPIAEEEEPDVTAATSAGADSSALLDLDIESESETGSEGVEEEGSSDNETVEFDLGETNKAEASTEDNVIDFDLASNGNDDIEIEASESEDAGLEIDLGVPEIENEEPIRLDVEDDGEADSDDGEISLDLDLGATGDIELDLSVEDEISSIESDVSPEIDLSMDISGEETAQDDVADIDFELSLDDTSEDSAEEEIDLDGTVEIPKNVDLGMDDDDDEPTVFVPRAAQPEEQSAEDEIATKLDLAKAYVELGDKDSAKTILDEVMAEGNDEQRKQADDLLGQI